MDSILLKNANNKQAAWLRRAAPWLLTLAVYGLVWLLLGVRYEVNDDATLANIASGAYGPDTQYLIYINVLVGWAVKPFYWLAPGLNWLYVLQAAADIGALGTLVALLAKKVGTKRGLLLGLVLLMTVGVDVFYSFQYVKNSGLYLVTGLALLAENLGQWNHRTAAGLAWALLGSMVRFQNFFAVGGACAALLLWRFFALRRPEKKRAVAAMLLLFACVGAAKGVDYLAYQTDGWREFVAYNEARTELADFRFQYITDVPGQLFPLGYTDNDYDMLKSWSFWDTQVWGTEQLNALTETLPTTSLRQAILDTLYYCKGVFDGAPYHLLLCGVALIWLFYSCKKNTPAFLGTMALFVALVFYLALRGRYPYRVQYVLALAAAVFGAQCCQFSTCVLRVPLKLLSFFVAVVFVGCLPTYLTWQTNMEAYRAGHVDNPTYTVYSQDKENLYLADSTVLDSLAGYDVLHPREKDFFSNIVALGGWMCETPFSKEALAAYGMESIYPDMVDASNVYLIDRANISAKEIYLKEHYGLLVKREVVDDEGGFWLYRIATVQETENQ